MKEDYTVTFPAGQAYGLTINMDEHSGMFIVAILHKGEEGSAGTAERLGVQVGDILLAIAGESVKGLPLEVVGERLIAKTADARALSFEKVDTPVALSPSLQSTGHDTNSFNHVSVVPISGPRIDVGLARQVNEGAERDRADGSMKRPHEGDEGGGQHRSESSNVKRQKAGPAPSPIDVRDFSPPVDKASSSAIPIASAAVQQSHAAGAEVSVINPPLPQKKTAPSQYGKQGSPPPEEVPVQPPPGNMMPYAWPQGNGRPEHSSQPADPTLTSYHRHMQQHEAQFANRSSENGSRHSKSPDRGQQFHHRPPQHQSMPPNSSSHGDTSQQGHGGGVYMQPQQQQWADMQGGVPQQRQQLGIPPNVRALLDPQQNQQLEAMIQHQNRLSSQLIQFQHQHAIAQQQFIQQHAAEGGPAGDYGNNPMFPQFNTAMQNLIGNIAHVDRELVTLNAQLQMFLSQTPAARLLHNVQQQQQQGLERMSPRPQQVYGPANGSGMPQVPQANENGAMDGQAVNSDGGAPRQRHKHNYAGGANQSGGPGRGRGRPTTPTALAGGPAETETISWVDPVMEAELPPEITWSMQSFLKLLMAGRIAEAEYRAKQLGGKPSVHDSTQEKYLNKRLSADPRLNKLLAGIQENFKNPNSDTRAWCGVDEEMEAFGREMIDREFEKEAQRELEMQAREEVKKKERTQSDIDMEDEDIEQERAVASAEATGIYSGPPEISEGVRDGGELPVVAPKDSPREDLPADVNVKNSVPEEGQGVIDVNAPKTVMSAEFLARTAAELNKLRTDVKTRVPQMKAYGEALTKELGLGEERVKEVDRLCEECLAMITAKWSALSQGLEELNKARGEYQRKIKAIQQGQAGSLSLPEVQTQLMRLQHSLDLNTARTNTTQTDLDRLTAWKRQLTIWMDPQERARQTEQGRAAAEGVSTLGRIHSVCKNLIRTAGILRHILGPSDFPLFDVFNERVYRKGGGTSNSPIVLDEGNSPQPVHDAIG